MNGDENIQQPENESQPPQIYRPQSMQESEPNLPPPVPSSPDFLAPETFTPIETVPPEVMAPSPIPPGAAGGKSPVKGIITFLVALIFIGGIGSLAYFVIFPMFFSQEELPGPVNQQPIETQQPLTHQSFLVSPPASEAEITFPDLSYLTIATELQNESLNQLADNQIKEIKIFSSDGQVPFSDFLSAISPSAVGLNENWFEQDFTALFYYDARGVWPIYVAKLASNVDQQVVQAWLHELETVWEVANFYLLPPDSFAFFKDGALKQYPTRYAVGSEPGASFNYGIFGPYLVLSTSFDGLKVALPLLGL